MDRSLAEVKQSLHSKVDVHDFTELLELLRKKLDVTVFLQAKTEIFENTRKLERDLRGVWCMCDGVMCVGVLWCGVVDC